MISVRLLFVAALLLSHCACGGKSGPGQNRGPPRNAGSHLRGPKPKQVWVPVQRTPGTDLSVPINADSGPQSETQQRVVPRISASDKPSSSAAAAAAASALPQTHNQHVGETSSASGNWRIWKYECNDLPAKCPRCRAMIKNILRDNNDASELSCTLCQKFWHLHENNKDDDSQTDVSVTSPERWPKYIKETETVFHNVPNLFDVLQASKSEDIIWPTKMGSQLNITKRKQVGMAIFREGTRPDFKHPSMSHQDGGYFSLTVFTKVGEQYHEKMDQLDQLFTSLLKYFFGIGNPDGLAARPTVRSAVCGIFVRAEVDLKDKNIANYDEASSEELPAKFRFEVWLLGWNAEKNMVATDLAKWTDAKKPEGFGFGELKFVKKSNSIF